MSVPSRRRRAALAWVRHAAPTGILVGFTAVPLAVFLSRALSRHWLPEFDVALIALRIRDVFSTHPPLLGAGTGFALIAVEAGANHPGPLALYLLAPIYAISGFRPNGLLVSLFVFHVGWAWAAIRTARRLGGLRLAAVAAASILLVERALGGDAFTRPFNAYLPFLALFTFLLAVWAVAAGDHRRAPLALFAGSVAAQSQVGFAVPVLVPALVLAGALALAVWQERKARPAPSGPAWRTGSASVSSMIGVLVVLVAWAPPLLEQARGRPGNLWRIVRWLGNDAQREPSRHALAMVSQIVGRPVAPLARPGRSDGLSWLSVDLSIGRIAVLAALLILIGVVAWRGSRLWRAGALVAAACLIASVIATRAGLRGLWRQYPYQLLFLWPLQALVWTFVGAMAVSWLLSALASPRWRTLYRWRFAAAALTCAALAGLALPSTYPPEREGPSNELGPIVRTAARTIASATDGSVVVECAGASFESACGATVLELERIGVRTGVAASGSFLWGRDALWRQVGPGAGSSVVIVRTGRSTIAPLPAARLVAGSQDPISAERHARASADLQAALDDGRLRVSEGDLPALSTAWRAREPAVADFRLDDHWFDGTSLEDWRAVLGDAATFVESGGIAVLAAAGLLADAPELQLALPVAFQPRVTQIWLAAPGSPTDVP